MIKYHSMDFTLVSCSQKCILKTAAYSFWFLYIDQYSKNTKRRVNMFQKQYLFLFLGKKRQGGTYFDGPIRQTCSYYLWLSSDMKHKGEIIKYRMGHEKVTWVRSIA
jgi:hypothetical protein